MKLTKILILSFILTIYGCGGGSSDSSDQELHSGLDTDLDGIDDDRDNDDDDDGVVDTDDAFSTDATESIDTDADGTGNNADLDDDNDGYSDVIEATEGTNSLLSTSVPADLDGDFYPDSTDTDIDGDNVLNEDDAFPIDLTETLDTDADGTGNNADLDDDNDGYSDAIEAIEGTNPLVDSSKPLDLDGDFTPDSTDTDIDGDSVLNENDACPMDPNETTDTDGDGICDNADPDSIVVQGESLSSGVVSAFGSIYINGVKYDTTNAKFVNGDLDDLPNAEQDLDVGDVVWIRGTVNEDGVTGIAHTVIYDIDLIGTVGVISPSTSTINVLGRTVQVNSDTVFGDNFALSELSDIALGDVLKISGFDQLNGSLLATRIDKDISTTDSMYKIEGMISALDLAAASLNIGSQIINYSAFNASFTPSVNQWIEVKGTLNDSGILIADDIEIETRQGNYGLSAGDVTNELSANTTITLEGVISEYTDSSTFAINGYAVQTDSQTLYIGGNVNDIAIGVRLSVKGVRLTNGNTLLVSRVYIRPSSNLEIEGNITTIDVLAGIVEVGGITVQIQSTTQLEDETGVYRKFSIEQLNIGDYIDVSGQFDGSLLVAYRLERDSIDNDIDDYVGNGSLINGETYYTDDDGYLRNEAGDYHVDNDGNYSDYQDTNDYKNQSNTDHSGLKLEGIATEISQISLTLYGNVIGLTATTVFELNDQLVTLSAFTTAASASPYVSVRATQLADGTLQALKIELEHVSGDSSSSGDNLSAYDFVIKGTIATIDTVGINLNNGYNLLFDTSTLYETYNLVSQAQFISDTNKLINPMVEIKALRNSAGQLVVLKVELESSDSQSDDDNHNSSEREFEGYGAIDNTGITIEGIRINFIAITYFELFDRRVEKAVFLSSVSGADKVEVKTRLNSNGDYEALKIELDD